MTFPKFCQKHLTLAVILTVGLPSAAASAMSESRTYFANSIYAERPELCTIAGTGCGKKAADAWCQIAGYTNAMSYLLLRTNRQAKREQLVTFGELCPQDACSGFQFVKCRRDLQQ